MKTIVITGGPCSGKSSAVEELKEHFAKIGQAAVFVEEAGTDLILTGTTPESCGSMYAFQTKVAALQRTREAKAQQQAHVLEKAANGNEVLVVCDRGIADGAAYVGSKEYLQVLHDNGLSENEVFQRYDAVFCLESIAQLGNGSYTVQNNTARSESEAEAAALDRRTYDAWKTHPQFHFIKNEESFSEKMDALIAALQGVL